MSDGVFQCGNERSDIQIEHVEYDDDGAARTEWAAVGVALAGLGLILSSIFFGVPFEFCAG